MASFLKSEDPDAQQEWYKNHLGIPTDQYGWTFWWHDKEGNKCITQWSPMEAKTSYFAPSKKQCMFNFRVDHLAALLNVLKEKSVTIVGEV